MLIRPRSFILLLIAILWFVIILPYLLVQTTIGANYASQLISHYNDNYSVSIGNVSHSIFKPYEIELENVSLKNKARTQTYLSAKKVIIVLKKDDLLQTHSIDYLLIDNGYIQYIPISLAFDINVLQLKNISLDYIDQEHDKKISLNNISGRISPWSIQSISQPIDSEFKLTIAKATYNELNIKSIFIEGTQKNNNVDVTNLGGDINHGFFIMKNIQLTDDNLDIGQLRLNNISTEIQSTNIEKYIKNLTNISIKQLSIINSSIATPELIIEKGNLEANNINYNGGWKMENSDVAFNAQSIVWHDELIENPLLQWHADNNKIILEQLIASWSNGNIKLSGSWQKNQLTIDNILAGGFRYQLPPNWYQLPDTIPLAEFLPTDIIIKQFTLMPSLIIDTDPYLPFQFTAFEAFGNDIDINTLNNQLNIVGKFFVKADSGTLNTVELNKPDLILDLTPSNYQLKFSTLIDQGLLDGSANIASKQLQSITLNAHSIDSQILPLWHLINNPIRTDKYTVELSGSLQPLSLDGQFITSQKSYLINNNQLIDH